MGFNLARKDSGAVTFPSIHGIRQNSIRAARFTHPMTPILPVQTTPIAMSTPISTSRET